MASKGRSTEGGHRGYGSDSSDSDSVPCSGRVEPNQSQNYEMQVDVQMGECHDMLQE